MRAIDKFAESMANKVGVYLAKPGKIIGFREFDEVRSLRTVKRSGRHGREGAGKTT